MNKIEIEIETERCGEKGIKTRVGERRKENIW